MAQCKEDYQWKAFNKFVKHISKYLVTIKLTKLADTLKPISANARCSSWPSIAPDLSVSYLSKAPFHCWIYRQSCWNSSKLMVPDWSLSKIPDKRSATIKMLGWPASNVIFIYAWIYENGALSKVDDIKIKRKVSPFFLPLPVYLPFLALYFLLVYMAWRRPKSVVKSRFNWKAACKGVPWIFR